MTREKAREKEVLLLLRHHNKTSAVKIKKESITIPEEIIDILIQKEKRTKEQVRLVEEYRHRALTELAEKSESIRKERLNKSKRTREANLQKDPRYLKHFGVWVNCTLPSAKITRENYAKIDNRSTLFSKSAACDMVSRDEDSYVYIDESDGSVRYNEVYCTEHQRKCLQNYDINMDRFASLDWMEFENVLQRFTKGRKFQQVYSLDEPICTTLPWGDQTITGFVYVMVLDKYKQAYVGITENTVEKRIKEHWKKKRAFDRLIFGDVRKSVISIDSFGPLDTTRIYVKPYYSNLKTPLEKYEYICIRSFDGRYLLNRLR